jgi:TP901 family phage tail tape measure protein
VGKFSIDGDITLFDKSTSVLNKLDRSFKTFSNSATKSIEGVNARMNRMQERTSSMAREMAPMAAVSAGMVIAGGQISSAGKSILGVFGSVIDEGAAFEKTMSNLAAVSRLDKTSDAFKELEQKALDLGASTVFSSKQVGEGMEFLARAGFTAKAQLSAIPDMLSLATVGNIGLARATDLATDTMGAFADQNVSLNRVANVMAATMVRSNVDMEQMGEALKFVALNANKAGIPIEQLAAMVGLLGNVGLKGSIAGTALRAAILRLSKPVPMAAKALKSLGVETMDASGNLRSIPTILEEIRQKTAGMGTGVRTGLIADIFGKVASGAMTELISKANKSGKSIEGFAEKIRLAAEADQLADMAKTMSNNVDGATKAFESASSAVKIGVFASIKDVWKKLLQIGAKFLLMVFEFTKRFPTFTKWVAIAAAVVGVLLVGLGALITVGGVLAGAFVMMKIAAAAFGITLSAAIWPVTLIVLGIIAVIAVVTTLIVFWEDIVNWFRNTPAAIQVLIAALAPLISIPLLIIKNWDILKAGFMMIWGELKKDFFSFVAFFGKLIDWASDKLSGLAPDWLVTAWQKAYAWITTIIADIGKDLAVIGKFFGATGSQPGAAMKKGGRIPESGDRPPVSTTAEKIQRTLAEVNIKAPPGTTMKRRGKKTPGIKLNLGESGACG